MRRFNKIIHGTTLVLSLVVGASAVLSGCGPTPARPIMPFFNENLYSQYWKGDHNKAYAVGSNKVVGAAWGQSSVEAARSLAITNCKEAGGVDCRIINVNDKTEDLDKSSGDSNDDQTSQ